jgi:hypothetical protein
MAPYCKKELWEVPVIVKRSLVSRHSGNWDFGLVSVMIVGFLPKIFEPEAKLGWGIFCRTAS